MILKKFQEHVVSEYKRFFETARSTKSAIEEAKKSLPPDLQNTLNWVDSTYSKIEKIGFNDRPQNGLREHYPRVCIKIPTGGGKTLLAVEAIREYQTIYARKKTGLIVWIVPSETIYSQTVKKLKDKSDYYRQLLDQSSGGKTLILEKGQKLTIHDVEENLVVLFLMIQSVSRKNAHESLKVFEDSGGYESFFPADNRYDLHGKLLEKIPNLDVFSGIQSLQPQVKTSLGNVVRLTNPLIIIDEIHKVFSPQAKETIDNLNPSMVLGFSATPKQEMNILVHVTGIQLKDEEMIKLDMHLKEPVGGQEKDWHRMLTEIKQHREKLEKTAIEYQRNSGRYIRPIALIQVERTGADQRGKDFVHSLDAKDYLLSIGIPEHEIAIKTSSQNDIEDINLLSEDCEIRYIITKEALREGWDCPFSYVLGIIPNVNSNTGTTQLVGRILRQPYVKKTGISELDESYVYFISGDTQNILSQIKNGFEHDGLEDLVGKIRVGDTVDENVVKKVKIKDEFRKKYEESLYLPVWMIVDDKRGIRRFNYDIDIKPNFNFSHITLHDDNWLKNVLLPALGKQKSERITRTITLADDSTTKITPEAETIDVREKIDINYLTQRLTEFWENPFTARLQANQFLEVLVKEIKQNVLEEHFGFIVSQIVSLFQKDKTKQERELFHEYIKNKKLILAVSDDNSVGFTIPHEDTITVDHISQPYQRYLFEDMEVKTMNTLEKIVADNLDKQDRMLWWFRNKTNDRWYSIQGWQKQKIRPDFVASRKNEKDELELVYVLESKGAHLLGNQDTQYKELVFELMNKTTIERQSTKTTQDALNTNVQFYMLKEEGEQSMVKHINTLFNLTVPPASS